MTASQFYQNYIADDSWSRLSSKLQSEILQFKPQTAIEFGCGSGKHLDGLRKYNVTTVGIDISLMNVIRAGTKYDLPNLICSSENILPFISAADVVFTCSVLDHIKDIKRIVQQFKRIAQKAIVIAETQVENPSMYYYYHDYESFGFKKLDFEFVTDSNGDGNTYHIWIYHV